MGQGDDHMSREPHFWGPRPGKGAHWHFALWAPQAQRVCVIVNSILHDMVCADGGVWRAYVPGSVGDTYSFVVDGLACPDPASRAQSGSVHATSVLCTPDSVAPWSGRDWCEMSVFEMHVGSFTPEGTLRAAQDRLADLADLGLTAVELMPIAQYPGRHGWGYDGVLPYAVHPAYGTRGDLRAFVEAAHRLGLSVILDVVYNHFGPDGAYLHQICPAFFDEGRDTPWGPAIDFSQRPVREFFIQSALMWIEEFGIEGLRIDAAHQILDDSTPAFLEELATRLRAAVQGRPLHLILEDERNLSASRASGLYNAQWNDDYHHAVHCLLTGEDAGYYASFARDPGGDLQRALAEGHVEQGQARPPVETPRGQPSAHLPPTAFVNANQTHDQIGNRALGERLIALADIDEMRVAHALLLTSPAIPMLFMGEEVGSRQPFQFFADYEGDLAQAVRDGRRAEFAHFEEFSGRHVPDPIDQATFARSHPYATAAPDRDAWRALTKDCLCFRNAHVLPLLKSGRDGTPEVHQIADRAFHATWQFQAGTLETVACFPGADARVPPWPDAALAFGETPGTGPFFQTRVVT